MALQHRGQESAGIVTSEGKCTKNFRVCKGMGMISNIFNDDAIRKLRGNLGIGHTRYSTSASSEEVNCQPFVVHTAHGAMAIAHNGELVNCESVRRNVSLDCEYWWLIIIDEPRKQNIISNKYYLLTFVVAGAGERSWFVNTQRFRIDHAGIVLESTRWRGKLKQMMIFDWSLNRFLFTFELIYYWVNV